MDWFFVPPIGAAKHEATPTAQAAASISQLRDSLSYIPLKLVTNLLKRVAIILAICTEGPSLPNGMPEPGIKLDLILTVSACFLSSVSLGRNKIIVLMTFEISLGLT